MEINDIVRSLNSGELSLAMRGRLREAAHSISEHNRIHQSKEPSAVFISEYLDIAADIFNGLADGELTLVGVTTNDAEVAHCDEMICRRCGTHLEGWSRVEIDDYDGCPDRTYYEYEFSFCPECGAKIIEE